MYSNFYNKYIIIYRYYIQYIKMPYRYIMICKCDFLTINLHAEQEQRW